MLRCPSDVTDAEWAVLAPLIPPAKRGGNKRIVDIRALFDGRLYNLSTGCQWRVIPKKRPTRRPLERLHRAGPPWSASVVSRQSSQVQRSIEDRDGF